MKYLSSYPVAFQQIMPGRKHCNIIFRACSYGKIFHLPGHELPDGMKSAYVYI